MTRTAGAELTLEVTKGSEVGRRIEVKRSISLSLTGEGKLEVREFRYRGGLLYFDVSQSPRATVPKEAGQRALQNGQQFSSTIIREGDVFTLGSVEFTVSSAELIQEKIEAARRKWPIILWGTSAILFALLALAVVLQISERRAVTQKEERSLALALNGDAWEHIDDPALPESFVLMLPKSQAFSPSPNERSWQFEGFRREHLRLEDLHSTPWINLPADPLNEWAAYPGRGRLWRSAPPRAGNGRFLHDLDDPIFLGDYYHGAVEYESSDLQITFKEGDGFGDRGSRPFSFRLCIELWDSLPSDVVRAGALVLSPDRVASDPHGSFSLIPKFVSRPISREHITSTSESQIDVRNAPYPNDRELRCSMHLRRDGQFLLIMTVIYPRGQEWRIDPVFEEIIRRAHFEEAAPPDAQQLHREALEYEEEANELLRGVFAAEPGVPANWERSPYPERHLKAFRLYGKAMIRLQRTGEWPMGADFIRIAARARETYRQIQGPENWYYNKYRSIQDLVIDREFDRAEREVTTLYDKAFPGQDPARYFVDEWFLFARARRELLAPHVTRGGTR